MNLYFRLIWTLFRAWRLPKLVMDDVFEREFRVLPNDIDVNLHMNNGRYLTVADLMTVEFFVRTGFLKILLKQKWKPVAGGMIMTFRRQLKLGQKYRIRYQWTGCDDHWNYFFVEFLTLDGIICAKGYSKGAMVSKTGLVPMVQSFEALDFERKDNELAEAVLHWKESEKKLMG
jgi:acyl-CoA thioesterase FadM